MKKLLISAISILVICLGLLYSRNYINSSNSGDKQTLTIFNWVKLTELLRTVYYLGM